MWKLGGKKSSSIRAKTAANLLSTGSPASRIAGIKDRRVRNAAESRVARLKSGNYGDHKRLQDGIVELRFIKLGLRICFAEVNDMIVMILCGGDKNTKGEQSRDIARAAAYWKDFERGPSDAEDE